MKSRTGASLRAASVILSVLFCTATNGSTQTIAATANRPMQAASMQAVGRPDSGAPLMMEITLGLRNRAALDRLIAEQQQPNSPYYHRWLTGPEFENSFGPSASNFAAVVRWLSEQGFTIIGANPAAHSIRFTGPVFMAERAFGTHMASFGDGGAYANINAPMIPAQFAGVISAIHGLDNLGRPYALGRGARLAIETASNTVNMAPLVLAAWTQPDSAGMAGDPAAVDGGLGPTFGPLDLQTFYDETPLLAGGTTGGGDCVAVVGDSDFLASAITLFNSQFGLPASSITKVLADSPNPGINGDEFEALWDLEWLHAAAPGSPISFYLGNAATAAVDPISDAIQRAVNDNKCSVINVSFGFCGKADTFFTGFLDPLFAKAAAQGQSIFVAQGDAGAADVVLDPKTMNCVTGTTRHVNEMGADPNVTAVGGTQFTPKYDASGNDIGSVPETVWNDGSGAGGGGASALFAKPGYQSGVTPADGQRDVPDIAAGASSISPGFFVANDVGGKAVIQSGSGFGTSIAAPIWSGIVKLIDQLNGARSGNINSRLYQLGALGDAAKSGLRDVSAGNNSFGGVSGFSALRGYDQASGWGTPDINVFVTSFQPSSTPVISAIPSTILVGGSFKIDGNHFTAGSVVNFFVATATGAINAGPLKFSAYTPTQLTIDVPATVPLGQGFVDVQVINTDQGFAASNTASALLQGSAAAGLPTITTVNGAALAATSSNPSYATNNVETVLKQGTTVILGGTGFDNVNGVAVDLFCACTAGKVGPFFVKPGAGLTSTSISFVLPGSGPNTPPTGPGSLVVSNQGSDGSYKKKSNAVSVPIGDTISVTAVTQAGSTITVDGTGFSTLTVINFFNTQSGGVVDLGGLGADGKPKIPLTVVNANRFSFTVPAGAVPGASYVQALNPPFVPFTSSGSDAGGAFSLK